VIEVRLMRAIVVGLGEVAQNLLDILLLKPKEAPPHLDIVAVVDRGGAAISPKGLDLNGLLKTKRTNGSVVFYPAGRKGVNAIDAIESVEAEVVLELTSSKFSNGEPGLSHMKKALNSGKHVVTVNKISLARGWAELNNIASSKGTLLRFSGTVGGGTPILNFAKNFHWSEIRSIQGILNGTTNYILTRMAESDVSMEAALREAQTAGFAESNPSYDIDGIDTACKLVILANWTMNRKTSIEDVQIEGISNIKRDDIRESMRRNGRIKLVGSINRRLIVKPMFVPRFDPICVDGALNAVSFKIELLDEVTVTGKGAGGRETARAILSDLMNLERRTTCAKDQLKSNIPSHASPVLGCSHMNSCFPESQVFSHNKSL